jgi:hypothetical protein
VYLLGLWDVNIDPLGNMWKWSQPVRIRFAQIAFVLAVLLLFASPIAAPVAADDELPKVTKSDPAHEREALTGLQSYQSEFDLLDDLELWNPEKSD